MVPLTFVGFLKPSLRNQKWGYLFPMSYLLSPRTSCERPASVLEGNHSWEKRVIQLLFSKQRCSRAVGISWLCSGQGTLGATTDKRNKSWCSQVYSTLPGHHVLAKKNNCKFPRFFFVFFSVHKIMKQNIIWCQKQKLKHKWCNRVTIYWNLFNTNFLAEAGESLALCTLALAMNSHVMGMDTADRRLLCRGAINMPELPTTNSLVTNTNIEDCVVNAIPIGYYVVSGNVSEFFCYGYSAKKKQDGRFLGGRASIRDFTVCRYISPLNLAGILRSHVCDTDGTQHCGLMWRRNDLPARTPCLKTVV